MDLLSYLYLTINHDSDPAGTAQQIYVVREKKTQNSSHRTRKERLMGQHLVCSTLNKRKNRDLHWLLIQSHVGSQWKKVSRTTWTQCIRPEPRRQVNDSQTGQERHTSSSDSCTGHSSNDDVDQESSRFMCRAEHAQWEQLRHITGLVENMHLVLVSETSRCSFQIPMKWFIAVYCWKKPLTHISSCLCSVTGVIWWYWGPHWGLLLILANDFFHCRPYS